MPTDASRARDGHSHACDDTTGERLSAAEVARVEALRVQVRIEDILRWRDLLIDEVARVVVEARIRTVGADIACGALDVASDALSGACTRLGAARSVLRVFDERREGSDATLARRGAA